MNLHIGVDNQFIQRVIDNVEEAGLSAQNKFIIRSRKKPAYIKSDVPFASVDSATFQTLVGDTLQYESVIIHQFSPLMYRWVARNSFNKLCWAPWGTDLYDLPSMKFNLYEPITRREYVAGRINTGRLLFDIKYWITNAAFRRKAYSKVSQVYTWMQSEYEFAEQRIHELNAEHHFFFYENPVPYHELEKILQKDSPRKKENRLLMIGNSATPSNNHMDIIHYLDKIGIKADLLIPCNYGEPAYTKYLKKASQGYRGGTIEFLEKRLDFHSYLKLIAKADGLVMNNIRPQGYGNIFMMLFLGKPVFLNPSNISNADLTRYGIPWNSTLDLGNFKFDWTISDEERKSLTTLLSHERSIEVTRNLFA